MAKTHNEIDKTGEEFIKKHEGDIPYVYDDAVYPTRPYVRGEPVRGTLTAGIGHAGNLDNYIGLNPIPQDVRDGWFGDDNDTAEKAVDRLVKVGLRQNQRNALVSFTFNVGVGAFENSTLLRELNSGKYEAVPSQLARWNKTAIDGRKVESPGLTKRRAAEAMLWSTGEVSEVGTGARGSPVGTPAKRNWLLELIIGKVNLAQIVGLAVSIAAIWGLDIPKDVELAIVAAVQALVAVFTWAWNLWRTRT